MGASISTLGTVAGVAVVGVFVVWTLATVLKLDDNMDEKMTEIAGHLVTFVPNYNFFAPTPGHYDYYLLYRDRLDDGTVTEWRQIRDVTEIPMRSHWLWNPNLYNAKALFDFSDFIVAEYAQESMQTDDEGTARNGDIERGETQVLEDGGTDSVEPAGADTDASADSPESAGAGEDEESSAPEYMTSIEDESYQLSVYYMQILNYVTAKQHSENAVETQFLIMSGSVRDNHEPVPKLLSNYHRLE